MRYQVIILLFCLIRNYLQISLSDNICFDSTRLKHYDCCYNYEMVNGICTGTTEPSSLSSQRVTAKETIVTGKANLKNNRSSKADWMIYILCITSCFFFTVFCHLIRTYRTRRSLEVRIINENVASETLTLYMSDNNEGDKKPLTFVKT
ncbi:uncharacterized protein [Mytilus edulis]|uniref:uncharacterized protein n=1 Tax=Mytilus edulis TaxID=6550 RepID=UPI0039EFC40C